MSSPAFRVAFAISGKGRLFRLAAEDAGKLGIEVAVAILDTDADASIEEFCDLKNIRAFRLPEGDRSEFDRQLTTQLTESAPDLIMLTFDKMIPKELVDAFPGRVLNVHMSLLPAFKGFKAMSSALGSGVKFAGATIHQVDHSMDGGPILVQCQTAVRPADSLSTLGKRIFGLLAQIYLQSICWARERRLELDSFGRLQIKNGIYDEGQIVPAIEPLVKSLFKER